jgi:hypothetical protein
MVVRGIISASTMARPSWSAPARTISARGGGPGERRRPACARAAVLGALLIAGCGSKKGSPADAAVDTTVDVAPESIDDTAADTVAADRPTDVTVPQPSCGGTVTGSGSTPSGVFNATDVNVKVIFTCNAINVAISDASAAKQLSLALHPSADGGADTIIGSHDVTAVFTAFQGGSIVTTTATLVVSAIGDPFAGTPDNPQPTGTLDATFALDRDGFTLSGSFSSPYCSAMACQH